MAKLGSTILATCIVLSLIVSGLGVMVRSAYALTDFDQATSVQGDPTVAPLANVSDEGQSCERTGKCHQSFLNVMIHQGNAQLAIANSCTGDWRHVWRRRNPHQTIRRWHDGAEAKARGSLCIPLHTDVREIRVTSIGGHCGFVDGDVVTVSNEPGAGGTLKSRVVEKPSLKLEGCHASSGNGEFGTFSYGGIALDFSDGYGFADTYAAGHFYGVYDVFEVSAMTPLGAAIHAIGKLNTYHFRVEILGGDRGDWHKGKEERDGR